jgi:TM2 domain-containing membrane protein YozV
MKSKKKAMLLSLFLGGIGVHKFYLKETSKAWLYLIFSVTCVPVFLSIIDFFKLWAMSDVNFDHKYNRRYLEIKSYHATINRNQNH